MRPARSIAAALLALAAPLAVSHGQAEVSLDLAATSVRYGDSLRASATTIAPSIRVRSGALSLNATGMLARFDAGVLSSQGSAEGAVLLPALGPVRAELRADAGGSAHEDNTRTGQYLGGGRLHLASPTRGLWIGGGAGKVWNGSQWFPLSVAEAAAWMRAGRSTALVSVTPIRMDSLRFVDLEAALAWRGERLELGAGVGTRSGGDRLPDDRSAWGSVSATLRVVGPLALVAGAGTYPVDYTQGYPGGEFVTLGVRLAPAPRPPATVPAVRRERTGPALSLGREREGGREVRVRAADARQVEIAGDFTDWQPLALRREGRGWWSVRIPVKRGVHQINVRIDGGSWEVPAGLTAIADEFGGVVGVLIVE